MNKKTKKKLKIVALKSMATLTLLLLILSIPLNPHHTQKQQNTTNEPIQSDMRVDTTNSTDDTGLDRMKKQQNSPAIISGTDGEGLIHQFYNTYFKDDVKSNNTMSFDTNGKSFTWQFSDIEWNYDNYSEPIGILKSSPLIMNKTNARYEDIYTNLNVSLEYIYNKNHLKEDIILNEKTAIPAKGFLSVNMLINYPEDLTIKVDGVEQKSSFVTSNRIEFYDENKLVYYLSEPYAVDANGNTITCQYKYENNKLSVQTPSDWLEKATYPVAIDPTVYVEVMFIDSNALWDCAAGEFNSSHEGMEVVVVGASKYVTEIYWTGSNWYSHTIATTDDPIEGVDIGDADNDGRKDIVIVTDWYDGPGVNDRDAKAIHIEWDAGWTATGMYALSGGNIYACAIGDFNTSSTGNETVVMRGDGVLREIFWDGAAWKFVALANMGKAGYGLKVGEFDSAHDGVEIVTGVGSGYVNCTNRTTSGYNVKVMYSNTNVYMDGVAIGDFNKSFSGNEVIVACGNGDLVEIHGTGAGWSSYVLTTSSARYWDVCIVEIDSAHGSNTAFTGNEIVTVDNGGFVNQTYHDGTTWVSSNLWRAAGGAIYGVASSNFDPRWGRDEIVTAG